MGWWLQALSINACIYSERGKIMKPILLGTKGYMKRIAIEARTRTISKLSTNRIS